MKAVLPLIFLLGLICQTKANYFLFLWGFADSTQRVYSYEFPFIIKCLNAAEMSSQAVSNLREWNSDKQGFKDLYLDLVREMEANPDASCQNWRTSFSHDYAYYFGDLSDQYFEDRWTAVSTQADNLFNLYEQATDDEAKGMYAGTLLGYVFAKPPPF